jgi:hypothetical protein
MVRLIAVIFALSVSAAASAGQRSEDGRVVMLQRQVDALARRMEQLESRRELSAPRRGKHAWPDLTDDEKAALSSVLATLPKSIKFDIVCNDAACIDLAMDIDDAMEGAGLVSVLDRSLGPLGYGIAVQVNEAERATAETAVAAFKNATGGRLDLPLIAATKGATPPGYVTIIIGKYRPQ